MPTGTLIIGGGLAGLSLAVRLQDAGHDYQLIEARGRFGGRIKTRSLAGLDVDLGPAWFWPGQTRMAAMAERFGLAAFEQFASGDIMLEEADGSIRRGRGYASMEGSYRIAGGLGRLVDGLLGSLPAERLRCDAQATAITAADGIRVDVLHRDAATQLRAERVVLALPPRLAGASIRFSPEWPAAALTAAQSMPTWMAGQAKFVAVYDRAYWRERGLSGDVVSRRGPMVEIHDASAPRGGPYALFGFVGVAPQVRAAHRAELLREASAQLVRLFGDALARPLAMELADWAQQPFTATARDSAALSHHPQYGLPDALDGLWDGRLLFGASEVAAQFGGYLEGALEASEGVSKVLL